jgi:topoisomerase (DNA) II binding protein 1
MHLADMTGATVQEYFVRVAKPRQNLQGSTHLVVNAPTGGKFNAANKWNIPAVDKM